MTKEEAISLLLNISAYDVDNQRGMRKQEATERAIELIDKYKAESEVRNE